MEKPKKRDSVKTTLVAQTAEICGVSKRQVYRVLDGQQDNDQIMMVYMELRQGSQELVEAVKQLVPFK